MIGRFARFETDWRYDVAHRKTALAALASVERSTGRRLAASERRDAEAYAINVLGSKAFAPWLFLYTVVAGRFIAGWMPDNFYGRIVCPNVNGPFRDISSVGSLASALFPRGAFPDVAYVIEGRYLDTAMEPLDDRHLPDVLFAAGDEIVVKRDGTSRGRGVQIVARDGFDADALARLATRSVIQHRIHQHARFETFVSEGTTTIRVTTVREPDGRCHVRAAYVRFPSAGDVIVRSATTVRSPVRLEDGTLHDVGFLHDWTVVAAHPDSGTAFAGTAIPGFAAAIQVCEGLHAHVPQVGCIGWDVMIDDDEVPWVLEWNAVHPDIRLSEATTGPCFDDLGWERLRAVRHTWRI